MIEVVSAVIYRDERILLQQRVPKRDYPMMWESPGGKVEEGEQRLEALHRELHEEIDYLGTQGDVKSKCFYSTVFRPPETKGDFTINFYILLPHRGWLPKMLDARGMGWFTLREMRGLTLVPGNLRLLFHLDQRDGIKAIERWRG